MGVCWISPALADSCLLSTSEQGVSPNGRYSVVINRTRNWAQGEWNYTWTDQRTGETKTRPVEGLEAHAHPSIFVADNGSRFAIIDLSAGHRSDDRILIYEPEGELIRSLGIGDILLFHERVHVSYSLSHTLWTGYDKELERTVWRRSDGRGLCLMTKSGTPATILWKDGTVIREPWTLDWLRRAPWLWLAAAAVLLLTRFLPGARGGRIRLALDLWSVIFAFFGVSIWCVWEYSHYFFGFMPGTAWTALQSGVLTVLCLVLLWTVLGRSRWSLDVAMIVVGVASIVAVLGLTYSDYSMEILPTVAGLSVGNLILLAIVARRGYRLRPALSESRGEDDVSVLTQRQFGFGKLFFCMSFVAFFTAATQLLISKQVSSHPHFYFLLQGIILSFFATAAVWTGLTSSRGSVGRCIAVLVIAVAGIYFAPRGSFRWPGVDIVRVQLSIYFLLMLLILLLVARMHGMRLRLPDPASDQ